jgi:hypothetical protein
MVNRSGFMNIRAALFCLVLIFSFVNAKAQPKEKVMAEKIRPAVFAITMVMMHDVVNPPAAARFHAYAMIGALDIVSRKDKSIGALQLWNSNYTAAGITVKNYDTKLAALYCILESGRLLLPSGYMLEEEQEKMKKWFAQQGYPKNIIDSSIKVATEVANHVLSFSRGDAYGRLSTRLRYSPKKGEEYWYPTPPAYMEAVEPHWNTVRPLLIDSCAQFKPALPAAFSKDTGSVFFVMAKEVYDISQKADKEQLAIAAYWDCNPFVIASSGHMSVGFKKISPGAHWMNISGIACRESGLDFNRSVFVQAVVGFTLMDAFISCWDEKYRSNRVRPETFINRNIDPKWQPLLQTPPFPEYTSGHSVISTAAAEVLTAMLGSSFNFTDDTELMFEMPERKFKSFRQAAEEAAISRLYGGIHYRDAIEKGQEQGMAVGKFIVQKLQLPVRSVSKK